MKTRIPKHREFIIDFPKDMDQAKADEGWAKLTQIVEDYKKAHNGQSVYAPPSSRTANRPSRPCRRSTASTTRSKSASKPRCRVLPAPARLRRGVFCAVSCEYDRPPQHGKPHSPFYNIPL